MKKYILLAVLSFTHLKNTTAQILCIYCYEQNDSISWGVNNLLLNGGFENSTCIPYLQTGYGSFCPNALSYNCDITDWTCTAGGSDTYADIADNGLSVIVEGNYGVYFGNGFCNSCSATFGDTTCLMSTGCTVTGIPAGYPVNDTSFGGTMGLSIEQTVSGLIPGNTYVLEFWAGGEGGFTKQGLFAVDVGFGDTLLRDKPTSTFPVGIGTRYIIEFNASSSSHTIKFTNWCHICNSCTELFIDDVRLYTLAELSDSVPSCSVGINYVNANTPINIFPNPVISKLNVTVNNNELSEIILYDIASRKIMQKKFTNSVSLNAEQLAKGIYLYEVRCESGSCKKGKVVKD